MTNKPKIRVEALLTQEEIKDLHTEADRQMVSRIRKEREERESNKEDFWRPCFPLYKNGRIPTQEEIDEEIFLWTNSDLYELVVAKYSGEDLHEYMYGSTPWEEYLANKISNK